MNKQSFLKGRAHRRRHLSVVLALAIPVALLVPAKLVTSWRPVVIGELVNHDSGAIEQPPTIAASQTELIAGFDYEYARFDLRTRQRRESAFQGITKDGAATWQIRRGTPCQLEIERQGRVHAYNIPSPQSQVLQDENDFYLSPAEVLDEPSRVQLLFRSTLLRWKPGSPQLQQRVRCEMDAEKENVTLARDGKSIIVAGDDSVSKVSTQSGRVIKRIPFQEIDAESAWRDRLSPFGSYAAYKDRAGDEHYRVVELSTGRTLWEFDAASFDRGQYGLSFSPDEKLIALPFEDKWEIRDVVSGALLRTLPALPYPQASAFSPDSGTLYTISGGVVASQRAR